MRITSYVYPDGTKGIRKPRDGEVFRVWDHVDNNEVVWQWDGYKEQWFRINSVNVPMEFITLDITIEADKCECGSEKAGSNRHSEWCKKWSADQ